MSRKVTLFLIFFSIFSLFAQESKKSLFINTNADFRDYFIATSEMLMVDLLVYDVNNLFLSEKPSQTSFEVFKDNITSPWIFDYSSFRRNQIFHPYFGALYFLSGRSNNLNFQESFLLSAAGSFLWESYLEGPVASLNDFITTPTAGAITGEILHRLSFSVYDISPLCSWVLSPVDGINQLLQNKRAIEPVGQVYGLSFSSFGGTNLNENSYNSQITPAFGFGMNLIYNNPFGHTTKEFYDQFSVDLFYSVWKENQLFKMNLDGLLYSHKILPDEKFISSLSITFDYDLLYGSNITLSNSSAGLCLKQSFGEKESQQFNYSIQGDFIYLGTSDIFYLIKNQDENYTKPAKQAAYTYKYGPEIKISAEYFNNRFGNIFINSSVEYLFTYKNSTDNEALKSNLFIFTTDFSYEHKIYKNVYTGLRDFFIWKNEYLNSNQNNLELLNNIDLYIKIICR